MDSEKCSLCNIYDLLPFICNKCHLNFCSDHILHVCKIAKQ